MVVESDEAAILWLIANGAMIFPVECAILEAVRLHQRAAASEVFPQAAADLFRPF